MSMTERLVKILGHDRLPLHGGSGQWPSPGEWYEVASPLIPCQRGLHVCTIRQSLDWLGPHIWSVEIDGERIDDDGKIVVSRARLVEEYTTWNERTARLFAADCAERVAPLFRTLFSDDSRIDDAIATARRYALGEASEQDLMAAMAAADAASNAAWSECTGSRASSAAWSAAASAASAARASASVASAAAWARSAACARPAARARARGAECDWQAERLRQYLDGEVL